jgi:hypothetical protein
MRSAAPRMGSRRASARTAMSAAASTAARRARARSAVLGASPDAVRQTSSAPVRRSGASTVADAAMRTGVAGPVMRCAPRSAATATTAVRSGLTRAQSTRIAAARRAALRGQAAVGPPDHPHCCSEHKGQVCCGKGADTTCCDADDCLDVGGALVCCKSIFEKADEAKIHTACFDGCCAPGQVCCGTENTHTCCAPGHCHDGVCTTTSSSATPNCGPAGTVSEPGTECCIAEGAATGVCCPDGPENVMYGQSVCHQNTDGNPDGTCCPPGTTSSPCNVGPPTTFMCCPINLTGSAGCCEYPPGTYTCCAPTQTCRVPAAFGSPPYGCV